MELVIRYDNLVTAAMTMAVGFVMVLILMPGFIPMLRRLKFGQEVREDGPEAHLKKQGTPTMGGACILIGAAAAAAAGLVRLGVPETDTLQILFLSLAFGAIGFADDFLKIRKHNSDGLSPRQKLILQLIAAVIFALWSFYFTEEGHVSGRVYIPLTGSFGTALYIDLPVFIYIPFAVFVILGTDNGVNFTDGLDGLCASVTAAVAAMFAVLGLINGTPGLTVISAAVLGALLGYLIFNVYPARIFMGDTGSLALGGFVASAAFVCGMELYIPIFGFIYLIEVVSVIIQVTYFKKTKGRRFFRMAPIHHHFELLGNSETRIVAAFTIATIFLCTISFLGAAC